MIHKPIMILLSIGIASAVLISAAFGDGLLPVLGCFHDYNGNGALDSGEFGQCVTTPQGDLCMLDAIPCTETVTAAVCPGESVLNTVSDQCEHPVRYRCAGSGTIYQTLAECSGDCSPSTDCAIFCPGNLAIRNNVCSADPTCTNGAYNQGADACIEETCPYGNAFACMQINGETFCSEMSCAISWDIITNLGSAQGEDDIQDNGPVSDENSCMGQIYIFTGKDRRCRTWGATIAFDDCCRGEDYLFGLAQCKEKEITLARLKGEGLCHYVGQYCSKEISLGFTDICVEESKSYCCFNSKLARIVQEQGRAQLSTFNGWGRASRPNCRGLTPEEFQVLDFSQIDLSEWHGDIETRSQTEIQENLQQGVTDFYNRIGN
jgi:hypothetical protein